MRPKHNHKKTSVLAYTPPPSIPVKSISGEDIKGDPIFGYLIRRLEKLDDFSILLVLKNYSKAEKYSLTQLFWREIKIKNALFFETYLLRVLFAPTTWSRIKKYNEKCKSLLDAAINNCEGIDKILMQSFRQQLPQFGLMQWRFIAAELSLKEQQSVAIGAGNEHSITKYPMLSAAKKRKIPTFGVQHGGISGQNMYYSFIEADKKFKPLPDFTLTWGSYVHNRLCKDSIYPPNSLIITGQIRTDIIPLLLKRGKSVRSEKKTLLYASQPIYHLAKTRKQMFEDVFRFQKEHPEFNVIIKPHPREFPTLEWIREIAKDQGVEADIRTSDLYELLSISDIVMTYYSTAGAEAIYFDNELIVYDYEKMDIARYHALGVAHMCSSYSELEEMMQKINAGTQPDRAEDRRRFKEERVYKIDGQTVERTIQAIRSMAATT